LDQIVEAVNTFGISNRPPQMQALLNFPLAYLIILSSLRNLVGLYRDESKDTEDENSANARNLDKLS